MIILDFLTPGDWRDSYESRLVNPNGIEGRGGYCCECLQDVFNCCKTFVSSNRNYFTLFKWVEIYIDSRYIGDLDEKGIFRMHAPNKIDAFSKDLRVQFPFGKKDLLFDVNSYSYLGRE